MEHPSHKNHVVDMTTAGMDAQRTFKYLYINFIFPTFIIRGISGLPAGKPT